MAASNGRKTSSSNKKSPKSAAKSAGKARGAAQKRKEEAIQRQQDSALFHEIGLIVLFAVMALLFCCNFGLIGPAGNAVSGVLFGIFGLTAYLAPVLLFLAVAFWFANEGNSNALRKLIAGIILFIMLGIICDLITGAENTEEGYNAILLYENCRDNKAGGGIIAGSIGFLLKNYLGAIGAVLVVLVCSVVCLILLTEKSLIDSLKRGGSRVREFSREDYERRREGAERRREDAVRRREQSRIRRQEQEEERARREEARRRKAEERENERILRMEKKVSGVMLDATLPKPEKVLSHNDMHEIILPEEVVEETIPPSEEPEIPSGKLQEEAQEPARETKTEVQEEVAPAFAQWDMPDLPIRIHREGTIQENVSDSEKEVSYTSEEKKAFGDGAFMSGAAEEPFYAENGEGFSDTCDTERFGNSETETYGAEGIIVSERDVYAEGTGMPEEGVFVAESPGMLEEEVFGTESLGVSEERGFAAESPGMLEEEVFGTESLGVSEERIYGAESPVVSGEGGFGAKGPEVFGQDDYAGESMGVPKQAAYGNPSERGNFAASQGQVSDSAAQRMPTRPTSQKPRAVLPQKGSDGMMGAQVPGENRNAGVKAPKQYVFPPISLLQKGAAITGDSERELKQTAMHLQQTLSTFGVKVTITDISQGPSVTRYELQPEQGVKVSKIVSLTDDIKLNLAAMDIRIEAPIPGKAAIGIEVPNKESIPVALRDLLETEEFKSFPSNLAFAVGKDIAGKVVVADIAKMPHMLIAGATGSGKSVCINTLIMGILYKANPEDVKLIMIDPKVVELSIYNGIPHLLIPVVTDPKKASAALHWGVAEMDDRYKKFAEWNVRDLKGYNKKAETMRDKGDLNAPKKLPQIVIIVDELADLMMVCPGEVEESICRLAQLARAAGIHLIIATQRPSVDVITGLIKANMPSRVAFSVSSGVDSRTILDMVGAEKLLGKGDMLFYPQGYAKPARVQGAFVSDNEVSDVVDFMKNQTLGNTYAEEIEEKIKNMGNSSGGVSGGSEVDELFEKAGRLIIDKDKASIGMLQRALQIGFNRAARIMDQLCGYGVVGEEEGTKPRKILMSPEQFEQLLEEV